MSALCRERMASVEEVPVVPVLVDRGGGDPVACHYAESVELLWASRSSSYG
ncbi:hypothetical protein [Streptomyces sp. NPDC001537]